MSYPLFQSVKCLRDLSKIIVTSFGPLGKGVLVRTATGSIIITKHGASIIDGLSPQDPISQVILKSVQDFVAVHGDFSKSYLAILLGLLEGICSKIFSSYVDADSGMTHQLAACVVHGLVMSIKVCRDAVVPEIIRCSFDAQGQHVETVVSSIIECSLCSMFENKTLVVLKDLILKMVIKEQSFNAVKEKCLYLTKHFKDICLAVDALPFSESKVVAGFIILRDSNLKTALCKEKSKVIILTGSALDNRKVVFSLEGRSLEDASKVEFSQCFSYAEAIQEANINVVLCPDRLPLALSSMLADRGVMCIEHLSEEDVLRLQSAFKISPVSYCNVACRLTLSHLNVGEAQFLKSEVLGKRCCIHLGPPVHDDFGHLQLLLCSMSPALSAQYSSAILNSIRSVHTVCVPCNYMPESNCSEILVTSGCGGTEMLISSCLRKLGKMTYENEYVSVILAILADAYELIPRTLFRNCSKSSEHRRFIEFQNAIYVSGLPNMGVGTNGCPIDAIASGIYESVNSKVALLFSVLELALQIVKIESCIPVCKSRSGHYLEVTGKLK